MSVITDASTPLTLNSLSNLELINKINSNTQLFINSNMLSNALLPYTTSNYVISISNILQTNINTKQNILTASVSLLGNVANQTRKFRKIESFLTVTLNVSKTRAIVARNICSILLSPLRFSKVEAI